MTMSKINEKFLKFGTDGLRGVANTELTPELAFALGRAGAYVLIKKNKDKGKILMAKDTRISCYMLEAAMMAGITSVGVDVHRVGVLPTPGVAHLVKKYQMDAGVMISASHNPVADNGIKYFTGLGYKLDDDIEREIEGHLHDLLIKGIDELPRPTGTAVGTVIKEDGAQKDYMAFLQGSVEGVSLKGLKVALDCANGATYHIAGETLAGLGAQVALIHHAPDGTNINEDCGSTHMASLRDYVLTHGMDLGIAFDGDGDRCLLVDGAGNIIEGDEMMSICAMDLKEKGKLAKDTLVLTQMSNLGLLKMCEEVGIKTVATKVGDRYVLEEMLKHGYNFGGEQSGHFIFLDKTTTGDGVLMALQILRIMKTSGKSLQALNTYMTNYPQVLRNAKVTPEIKENYGVNPAIATAIKALEEKYAGIGRLLIRPSGTEALVRVMIEANVDGLDEITKDAEDLRDLLERA